MAEAQKRMTGSDELESGIMDIRRRIDADLETLNGTLRRAADWRRILDEYKSAFIAAAFMAGLVVGIGRSKGGQAVRKPRTSVKQSSLSLNFLLRLVQPALTEMLLQRIKPSCDHASGNAPVSEISGSEKKK